MHDLMYSREIITVLKDKLRTLDKKAKITSINVVLSPLSHVKAETLVETFKATAAGTGLEKIALNIRPLELAMKCASCGAIFTIDKPAFSCRKCDSRDINLADSKEFAIESITTEPK